MPLGTTRAGGRHGSRSVVIPSGRDRSWAFHAEPANRSGQLDTGSELPPQVRNLSGYRATPRPQKGFAMSVWFEGSCEVDCDIEQVKRALENPGEFYVGIVRRMPGLTSVELVEQGNDSVTIRTNEGLMKRSNITKRIQTDHVGVEFDERYEAGSKVTTTSHFSEDYTAGDPGVTFRLVMSDVEAPGFLGFFYQRFGNSKTGNAFLQACKAHFEEQHG